MTKRPEVTRRRTMDPDAGVGADAAVRAGANVLSPKAAEVGRQTRLPTLALPIDTLAEYVGATAVISGGLLLAGLWSTAAYLSAWEIPVWLVALDPLSTALRADSVVYLGLLAAAITLAIRALAESTTGRQRMVVTGLVATLALVVAAALAALDALGVAIAIAIAGGALTFAAAARGLVGGRGMAGLIVAVAIVAGYQASATMGARLRDDPPAATRVAITTLSPVAGLDGGMSNERGWEYRDLVVIFRDNNSVYVSRPGSGASAWSIPNANVMSVGIGIR